jgi:flagellar biogenesis protein FliO
MTASGSLSSKSIGIGIYICVCIGAALLLAVTPAWSDVPANPNAAAGSANASKAVTRGSQYQHLPLGRSIGDVSSAKSNSDASAKSTANSKALQPGALRTSKNGGSSAGVSRGTSGGGASGGWWDTVSALALVLVLIFGLRYVFLRWSGQAAVTSRHSVVEVLSRVSIAPRQQVVLLRLGNRVLLVGHSSGAMCTLADVHDPQEVASLLSAVSAQQDSKVGGQFAKLLGRHDSGDDIEAARFNSEPDQPNELASPQQVSQQILGPVLVPDGSAPGFESNLATAALDSGGKQDMAQRGILDRLKMLATRSSA